VKDTKERLRGHRPIKLVVRLRGGKRVTLKASLRDRHHATAWGRAWRYLETVIPIGMSGSPT
jgi:hypothetical protein